MEDSREAEFSEEGFVPCDAGDTIVLDRCGLARVAAVDDGITCELYRGLIDGLLEGRGTEHVVRLRTKEPYAAGCEVHLPAGHPDDPSTDRRRC